jgi:hypothetical protein
MEVHAHTHTARKKWTHYLWEFLMLFLAVFCGFLAENEREHIVEHQREKQYIESMIADIRTDSTVMGFIIKFNKQQESGFDSLLQNIYHQPYTDSSLRTLYYLKERYTLVGGRMRFSRGTISQLKNSGGLRLIRNRAVADSIIRYDIITERAEDQFEGVDYSGKKLLDVSVKIFDGECVFDYNSSSNYRDILSSNKKFYLLTTEEKIIKEYANLAKFKKDVIINYIRQLTNLQSRIPAIIQFLEKEYHLE